MNPTATPIAGETKGACEAPSVSKSRRILRTFATSSLEKLELFAQAAEERRRLSHPGLAGLLEAEIEPRELCLRAVFEDVRGVAFGAAGFDGTIEGGADLVWLLHDLLDVCSYLQAKGLHHGRVCPEAVAYSPERERFVLLDRLEHSLATVAQLRKDLESGEKLSCSPELFALATKKDPQVSVDFAKNESFAIGLTFLAIFKGESLVQDLFDRKGHIFRDEKLAELLSDLESSFSALGVPKLTEVLCGGLLNIDPSSRLTPARALFDLFSAFEKQLSCPRSESESSGFESSSNFNKIGPASSIFSRLIKGMNLHCEQPQASSRVLNERLPTFVANISSVIEASDPDQGRDPLFIPYVAQKLYEKGFRIELKDLSGAKASSRPNGVEDPREVLLRQLFDPNFLFHASRNLKPTPAISVVSETNALTELKPPALRPLEPVQIQTYHRDSRHSVTSDPKNAIESEINFNFSSEDVSDQAEDKQTPTFPPKNLKFSQSKETSNSHEGVFNFRQGSGVVSKTPELSVEKAIELLKEKGYKVELPTAAPSPAQTPRSRNTSPQILKFYRPKSPVIHRFSEPHVVLQNSKKESAPPQIPAAKFFVQQLSNQSVTSQTNLSSQVISPLSSDKNQASLPKSLQTNPPITYLRSPLPNHQPLQPKYPPTFPSRYASSITVDYSQVSQTYSGVQQPAALPIRQSKEIKPVTFVKATFKNFPASS